MTCSIYTVGAVDRPITKIGISTDPWARRLQIQNTCPFRVILGLYVQFPERWMAEGIEEAFLDIYKDIRIRGEWFNMPLSDAVLRLALYVDFRLTMLDDEVQDCIVERQAILYYFSSTYPKPTFFWDNHAQDLESRARNRAFRDQLNEERRHRREQRERRE